MSMSEPTGYVPAGYVQVTGEMPPVPPATVTAPPVNIVVGPPAPPVVIPVAPAQTLVTPPIPTGTGTSEFIVTLAEMVVYLIAGAIVSLNPGLALTSTEQSTLGGVLVLAFSWAATHFRHTRQVVKVAQLNNTATLPADPTAAGAPPVMSPAPAPAPASLPPRHFKR